MANSLDDMLKNQLPKKKKVGPRIFLFLIIVLVIALVGALVYLMYLKKQDNATPKSTFIQYLGKGNVIDVLNLEKMDAFLNRVQTEAAENTTEISGTVSSGMIESELDISDMKLILESKNDPAKEKNTSDISITYKENEILKFNVLGNKDKVGIISEDIVVKYLGSKYANLGNVLSKVSGENVEIDFSQMKDMQIVFPKFSQEMFIKYIDIINQKAPEEAFSSKEVILDNVQVTEYTMQLKESQVIEILDMMLRTLEEDDALLDTAFASLGNSNQEIKEQFKAGIESYINSFYSSNPDDSKIYAIKVYGANDILYKVAIDFYGTFSVEINHSYEENKNGITITFLENTTESGYSVDIIKTVSDVSENLDITFNQIEDSEIVGKINFVYDLVASGNSYTLKNKVDINFMIFAVTIQSNSQINFKQVSIKDLTEENCLFLDELDDEQFNNVIEAVTNRTDEVINEKLIKQGVRKPEEEELNTFLPPATINTEEQKENAKNKLINSISEAMGEAQEAGRTYGLIDLMVLEIPDTMISVSIENDIAIINIDGFEFKLNSEFQLYE